MESVAHNELQIISTTSSDWNSIYLPEAVLVHRKSCLKPALKFAVSGMDPNEAYQFLLKITQVDTGEYSYDQERNVYTMKRDFKEAKMTPQIAYLPECAGDVWVTDADKYIVNFEKITFSKAGGLGVFQPTSLRRYQATLVIQTHSGREMEFTDLAHQFVTTTKSRLKRGTPQKIPGEDVVPRQQEEVQEPDVVEEEERAQEDRAQVAEPIKEVLVDEVAHHAEQIQDDMMMIQHPPSKRRVKDDKEFRRPAAKRRAQQREYDEYQQKHEQAELEEGSETFQNMAPHYHGSDGYNTAPWSASQPGTSAEYSHYPAQDGCSSQGFQQDQCFGNLDHMQGASNQYYQQSQDVPYYEPQYFNYSEHAAPFFEDADTVAPVALDDRQHQYAPTAPHDSDIHHYHNAPFLAPTAPTPPVNAYAEPLFFDGWNSYSAATPVSSAPVSQSPAPPASLSRNNSRLDFSFSGFEGQMVSDDIRDCLTPPPTETNDDFDFNSFLQH